jgi:hypothetical protein
MQYLTDSNPFVKTIENMGLGNGQPNPDRPAFYIPKACVYRHPLVNKTMFKKLVNGSKIKRKSGECLYWLIVQAREQKTSDKIIIYNNYFVETIDCAYRTVTRALTDLQNSGYIIRQGVLKSDGKKCRTTNKFEICWLKIYEDFGDTLFTDFMDNMIKFIKEKIASAKQIISSLCRPFCRTDKPISSKEEDIHIDCRGEIMDPTLNLEENDVLLKGEYGNLPVQDLIEAKEPDNRTYFNREVRTCPEEWTDIALKEGMNPEYIEDEFIDFRDYWVGVGKIKNAKKANWSRTWLNRIRETLRNTRTSYKSISTQDHWKMMLRRNGSSFSLATAGQVGSYYTSKDAPEAIIDCLKPKYTWEADMPVPDSFGAIFKELNISSHLIDEVYVSFRGFYAVKAETKLSCTDEVWLERWEKWVRNYKERNNKAPVKEPFERIKEKMIDYDTASLPDEIRKLHVLLKQEMGEERYLSCCRESEINKVGEGMYTISFSERNPYQKIWVSKNPIVILALNKYKVKVI